MAVTGTLDWVQEYNLRNFVIKKFTTLMNLYGFEMVEPSILERYELFVRTVGESSDIMQKEMFFAVSKDNQDLNIVLRPEFTTSVIRSLIESGNIYNKRVSYSGKVFRHNRPQKGRYREFSQLGCEVFGDHPYIDVDVISTAVEFLKTLGLHVKVKINSLGNAETIAKYSQVISEHFKKNNTFDEITNPMRILDKMSKSDKENSNIPKIKDYMSAEELNRFESVCNGLSEMGISFEVDEYLVRGLDYYTNTIFEIENDTLSTQSSILGGGCYSGLVKRLGGPDISGIGWSFGLERILMMNIPYENKEEKYVLISINEHDYSLKVANMLRTKHNVTVLFDDFKKAMKKLSSLDPSKIIFCGKEEKDNQTVKVKYCQSGEQKFISFENLLREI